MARFTPLLLCQEANPAQCAPDARKGFHALRRYALINIANLFLAVHGQP
jgi:hypothetical protein